jgi:heme/copper-type cytochrome/quinol oxidase subunit 2
MSDRKRLLPIAITVAATFVLTVGSFFGCAHNFMSPKSTLAMICFWSFFVFGAACVVSFIWLLVAIVMNIVAKRRRSNDGTGAAVSFL